MTTPTPQETLHFERLYHDGAWTQDELHAAFSRERAQALHQAAYLATVPTEMGKMTLLIAAGRKVTFRNVSYTYSLARQLDWAYVRLSSQARGWRIPNEQGSRGLEDYDRSGRFVEMYTEFGPALVTGRLGQGGYSAQSLQRVADRLRSSALFHDFRVVVLTPHPRREQGIARSNAAFLKVVFALPRCGESGEIGRVRITGTWGDTTPNLDAVITTHGADKLSAGGVPDLTLDILQMTRKDRIQQAEEALALDGVMTAAQLERHFQLDPRDLPGRHVVPALVRPVHSRHGMEVPVQFLLASRNVAKMDDQGIAHRAGTAELRHLKGIPPERSRWQVNPKNTKGLEEPDAVSITAGGKVAYEFDNGIYPWTDIRAKLQTWHDLGYVDVIWGVSGEHRQAALSTRMGRPVALALWWKGDR